MKKYLEQDHVVGIAEIAVGVGDGSEDRIVIAAFSQIHESEQSILMFAVFQRLEHQNADDGFILKSIIEQPLVIDVNILQKAFSCFLIGKAQAVRLDIQVPLFDHFDNAYLNKVHSDCGDTIEK